MTSLSNVGEITSTVHHSRDVTLNTCTDMQFGLHVRLTELCNTKKNQFRLDFPLCSHNDMIKKKSENVHFQLYFSTLN